MSAHFVLLRTMVTVQQRFEMAAQQLYHCQQRSADAGCVRTYALRTKRQSSIRNTMRNGISCIPSFPPYRILRCARSSSMAGVENPHPPSSQHRTSAMVARSLNASPTNHPTRMYATTQNCSTTSCSMQPDRHSRSGPATDGCPGGNAPTSRV